MENLKYQITNEIAKKRGEEEIIGKAKQKGQNDKDLLHSSRFLILVSSFSHTWILEMY